MSGDLGSAFEIHQAEPFTQPDVVQGLEREHGRIVQPVADFQVGFIAHSDRRFGMRQVGDRAQNRVGIRHDLVQVRLRRARFFPQRAAFGFACFAFGWVLGLADRFADLVGLPIQLVDFHLCRPAPSFERDELPHVGRRAAPLTVQFHLVGMFDDKSAIEHSTLFRQ